MGMRAPGRLQTCLIIPTTQVSEVHLSLPFITIGKTGWVGRGPWLCWFQLGPSDSITQASLAGSSPPHTLRAPSFCALNVSGQVQGCGERGEAFPQTTCRWHQSLAKLSSVSAVPGDWVGLVGADATRPGDYPLPSFHWKALLTNFLSGRWISMIYSSNPDPYRLSRE